MSEERNPVTVVAELQAEIERLTALVVRAYMAGAKAAWDNELAGYDLPESAVAWLAAQELTQPTTTDEKRLLWAARLMNRETPT